MAASGLASTSGSAFGATAGGTQPGLKRKVEALEAEIASQAARIDDVVARVSVEDDTNSDIIDSFRAELAAAIREMKAEFTSKLTAVTTQVSQLQRQINVAKGESNILAQQNKDTARRVAEVAEQLQRLAVEVVGDDDAETAVAATF